MNYRIGFCINSIGGGGAERVISILCSGLAAKGYEVHLICNCKQTSEYPIDQRVVRHFVGEKVSSYSKVATIQRFFRIRRICKEVKLNVLVAFMGMNGYSVLATKGLRTKNIISIRNEPNHLYPTLLKRSFARFYLSFSSGAVFQTQEVQRWFPKRLQKKSIVILNPVGEQFYSVIRNPEPGLLVATGRLVSQKNYPMMLRSFRIISQTHNVKLEIYGKGKEEQNLKSMVSELGIESLVSFKGQSNDIPRVLSRTDIYLMASDYEGLPNALMEAMAVGVPCVATDCIGGGTRLLLGENERGLLVKRGSIESFTNAICYFLDNPHIKDNYSIVSREYAKQYSVDCIVSTWESFLVSFF